MTDRTAHLQHVMSSANGAVSYQRLWENRVATYTLEVKAVIETDGYSYEDLKDLPEFQTSKGMAILADIFKDKV